MSLQGAVILQVIPDLSAGGAERTTVEIAEALRTEGATALVASRGGRLEQELARVGGELVRMHRIGSKNPLVMQANAAALVGLIRKRGVNLIHARSRAPAWGALWAARRARLPFVTTYHGAYRAQGRLKRLYNSVMARGDVVIANSDFTADHVRAEYPFAAGRVTTIPRGVDIAAYTRAAVTPDRIGLIAENWKLDRARGETLILLAGRLTGWKGQREAIRAAARLHDGGHGSWRMVIAGDAQGRNAYVRELDDMIAGFGLGDRIAIVGHCSDMPAAYALADIVIAPSNLAEAFGRVAAEAGAMGVPVVGSDLGGQREVIVDGETGLLTPPGDVEALAEAIAALLTAGPAGRRAMGEAAISRVREKFTTAALQRATLAVYDRLMGRPR